MKKLITKITVILVMAMVVSTAGAVSIESINANYLNTTFTPDGYGLGDLSVNDTADIVVEYPGGSQSIYAGNAFVLDISLHNDLSADLITDGLFKDGSLSIGSSGDLLSATIEELRLTELYNNSGILAGIGELQVTGGSLAADFGALGEMVQISFSVTPSDLDDFSQGFAGISNISFMPIPEPATIAMIGFGAILLKKRKHK